MAALKEAMQGIGKVGKAIGKGAQATGRALEPVGKGLAEGWVSTFNPAIYQATLAEALRQEQQQEYERRHAVNLEEALAAEERRFGRQKKIVDYKFERQKELGEIGQTANMESQREAREFKAAEAAKERKFKAGEAEKLRLATGTKAETGLNSNQRAELKRMDNLTLARYGVKNDAGKLSPPSPFLSDGKTPNQNFYAYETELQENLNSFRTRQPIPTDRGDGKGETGGIAGAREDFDPNEFDAMIDGLIKEGGPALAFTTLANDPEFQAAYPELATRAIADLKEQVRTEAQTMLQEEEAKLQDEAAFQANPVGHTMGTVGAGLEAIDKPLYVAEDFYKQALKDYVTQFPERADEVARKHSHQPLMR